MILSLLIPRISPKPPSLFPPEDLAPANMATLHTTPDDKVMTEQDTFFDEVGQRYEDAYCRDSGLLRNLERFVSFLQLSANPAPSTTTSASISASPQSQPPKILDCGCGTGKPVAQTLAQAGFAITGIDFSQTMLDLARKNVLPTERHTFQYVDMLKFDPDELSPSTSASSSSDPSTSVSNPTTTTAHSAEAVPSNAAEEGSKEAGPKNPSSTPKFSGIVAMFSLFTLSRSSLTHMIRKWSSWLLPGGYLLIGTMAVEDFQYTKPEMYDKDGLCASNVPERFMDQIWSITLFTREGWRKVLEEPPEGIGCEVEPHLFVIVKKKD